MTTAARTTGPDGGHWYTQTGEPAYEVPYADPKKGMRKTTLTDARKLQLLPSVTTILKVLHKQALVDWLIEQSCLAVLTTPRKEGEELDAFVERVLHVEKVQDQEGKVARDRGTAIHSAIETALAGGEADNEVWPWCAPAYREITQRGRTIAVEKILVGDGYAGRVDLIQEGEDIIIYDWKTTRRLPTKGAYQENVIQAAAYAAALSRQGTTGTKRIRTANVYISTTDCGQFVVCEHDDWYATFNDCWIPLLRVWSFLNNYNPLCA